MLLQNDILICIYIYFTSVKTFILNRFFCYMSLRNAINNTCLNSNVKIGEVELFRSMINYFKGVCPSYYYVPGRLEANATAQEIHGRKGIVEFDAFVGGIVTKGSIKRRELADLILITFSPQKRKVKISFIQAKYERKHGLKNNKFSFNLDYFQYYLLNVRPRIKDLSIFRWPEWIISHPCYTDDVTSYGVFYKDSNGKYDFAYEQTSLLKANTNTSISSNTKTRVYSFNAIKDLSVTYGNDTHLISTVNVDTFEQGVRNLQIGSPIPCCCFILEIIDSIIQFRSSSSVCKELIRTLLLQFEDYRFYDDRFLFDAYFYNNSDVIQGEINTGGSSLLILNVDE